MKLGLLRVIQERVITRLGSNEPLDLDARFLATLLDRMDAPLASRWAQILLQRALGLPTPRYLHLPLVLDEHGRKLSKSAAALPVDSALLDGEIVAFKDGRPDFSTLKNAISSGGDMTTPNGWEKAVKVYNNSMAYARNVLAWAASYATGVVPVIHQVETHPYWQQRELREVEGRHGIVHESWSPLGQGGDLLADPVVTEIAEARGATPAQVVIAWHLAKGFVVIPKSVTPERIVSNLEAAGVELTADDVARIDALDREDGRLGPDPAVIDF